MTTARATPIPFTLGPAYTLERELGGGGMARVFLATEVALRRRVVLKVLPPELGQGLSAERFAREIALAAALQDPHIVPVLTAGTTPEGLPYYTMPWVEGESLRTHLVARPAAAGPLPLSESVAILRDVARALEYAHARGVVHRDIKPENVLLAGRGALVADFGIARALREARTLLPAAGEGHASVGMATGTPAYMAPEQAAGRDVDAGADLYAWGVLAYELLAGRHPFAGRAGARELMTAHVNEAPPSLAAAAPHVPPALAALVMQCLAKEPRDRPADATALLEGLTTGGDSGEVAMLPPSRVVAQRARAQRRRRALLAAAGGALVTAAALVAWQRLAARDAAPAPIAGEVRAASASIAVLPFEHQGDSADAYVTDGITDEIRGRLAGVRDLVVIARASSTQYRRTARTPRHVAEELGVRWLLTGTVRVSGSGDARRVVVRPELVEVPRDGAPRSAWAAPFDAAGADLLRVQGEIAGRVVDAMEVAVTGADRARVVQVASRDAQAYDAYLRGQAAVQHGADVGGAAQLRAIPRFEEAVRRDSLLLEAWVALARSRMLLYSNGRERTPALAAAAREAAERVVALDPNGARGHMAMGTWRRLVARDLDGARRDFEAAVRRDPGDGRAAGNLALLLDESLGRAAEALPHYERARTLDPRNVVVWSTYAAALAALGRQADARAAAERARALAPANELAAVTRLDVELAAGDTAAARTLLATMLRELPPARTAVVVGARAGWLLDEAAAARLLAVGADAFDGDRGEWALQRAELLARRRGVGARLGRHGAARPLDRGGAPGRERDAPARRRRRVGDRRHGRHARTRPSRRGADRRGERGRARQCVGDGALPGRLRGGARRRARLGPRLARRVARGAVGADAGAGAGRSVLRVAARGGQRGALSGGATQQVSPAWAAHACRRARACRRAHRCRRARVRRRLQRNGDAVRRGESYRARMTRTRSAADGRHTSVPPRHMTAAELLAYHDFLDRPTELVRGRLVVSEPPGWEHGRVALRIGSALLVHLDRVERDTGRRPGEAMSNDPGCWIERDPDTVRAPDVAYVAADRLPPSPIIGFIETAPTIAVEVRSPSDRPRAVRTRVAQWLAAGAALVWDVDPRRRSATIHRADGSVTRVARDGVLDGEPVLPGFRLPMVTIFP